MTDDQIYEFLDTRDLGLGRGVVRLETEFFKTIVKRLHALEAASKTGADAIQILGETSPAKPSPKNLQTTHPTELTTERERDLRKALSAAENALAVADSLIREQMAISPSQAGFRSYNRVAHDTIVGARLQISALRKGSLCAHGKETICEDCGYCCGRHALNCEPSR